MTAHANSDGAGLLKDLQAHFALCAEILRLVTRENQALRSQPEYSFQDYHEQRKVLLPRLNQSVSSLNKHRLAWQGSGPKDQARRPAVPGWLRSNLDLIMKIVMLDRENEQLLLRRGLTPAPFLPAVNRQRPHFVADLYRRHATA